MKSGKIKALFIINALLEKKTGKDISRFIEEYLDHDRFNYTLMHSDYPGHEGEIARQNASFFDLVVAGGGDGTVNQVACILVHTETALGILPMGSGKGLARSLGIPLSISGAIEVINRFRVVRIDTGRAGLQRFVNIAGIGFAAEVAHAYAGSRRRGLLPYALNTAKKLPFYPSVSASIEIGDRIVSGKYFDITFANSTQWGYGAHISPTSKPDDGILEVCLFRKFPVVLVPGLLARLYSGTIHRSRYMEVIPAEKASISGNGSFKGHIDGEPVEFTAPFDVSIDPLSLKVLSPGQD